MFISVSWEHIHLKSQKKLDHEQKDSRKLFSLSKNTFIISNERSLGFKGSSDVETKSLFRRLGCLTIHDRAASKGPLPRALYELQIFGKFSLGKFSR